MNTKIFPRTLTTFSPQGFASEASGSVRANARSFSRAPATAPDDTPAMSVPAILDCDPGHDDAIALLLALASPELELLGVTTTYGNQTLEKTTTNALRVLELVERTDISVAAGADRPLVRELVVAAHVHGESGLDGPTLPDAATAPIGDDAVAFMAAQVDESSEPVVLVATGPLTNVARYLASHGTNRIARIVLMGGAIAEGNFTPAAEFNIWCDPEAAAAVFASGLDVTMMGLDVTHQAILGPHAEERLRVAGRVGAFVADLNVYFTRYHRETYGWDGAPIHDAVAVAHLIRPGLVDTRHRNVEVELESELNRGRTVVDLWNRTDRPRNAHVGVDLDVDGFFDLLVERVATLG
jgi:pyrimidine-specific ribonucleoside hydrolase